MEKQEKNKIATQQLWLILLFSLSAFVLSYLIVFVLSSFLMAYIASDFEIPVIITAGQTIPDLPSDSIRWTADSIISVYSSAPFSSFFIGVLGLFFVHFNRKAGFIFLNGILWLIVHAFTLSFGKIVIDLLTQTGFTRAAGEMGAETVMKILTIGVGFFFLYKLGIFVARIYHTKLFTGYTTNPKNSARLLLFYYVLPWLFGFSVFVAFNFQSIKLPHLLLFVTSLILVLPSVFFKPESNSQPSAYQKLRQQQALLLASFTLVLLLVFSYFFMQGVTVY